MNRNTVLSIIGVVVAIGAGYFIYESLTYVNTDNAQVEGHAVMITARTGGYVRKVNFLDGQKVAKDEVLVEIDDRDATNALNQLKASLTAIAASKHEAELSYKRMLELNKSGAVSQSMFDKANAAYSSLKGQYDSLEAQIAQAGLNLEYTKVKAPMAGFIARKSVEVGQLVAPGVPLTGFVGAEERWVTANFKETEIPDVKIGAKVDIDVDALPSQKFEGTVETMDPATGATFTLLPADNATGNFTKVVQRVPVRIKLEKLTEKDIEALRTGLSAIVKVHKH